MSNNPINVTDPMGLLPPGEKGLGPDRSRVPMKSGPGTGQRAPSKEPVGKHHDLFGIGRPSHPLPQSNRSVTIVYTFEYTDVITVTAEIKKRGIFKDTSLGKVVCQSDRDGRGEYELFIQLLRTIMKERKVIATIVIKPGMTPDEVAKLYHDSTELGQFLKFLHDHPEATYGLPVPEGESIAPRGWVPKGDVKVGSITIRRPWGVAFVDSLAAGTFGRTTGPGLPPGQLTDGDMTPYDDKARKTTIITETYVITTKGTIKRGPTLVEDIGPSRLMCEERGNAVGSTAIAGLTALDEMVSGLNAVEVEWYDGPYRYYYVIKVNGREIDLKTSGSLDAPQVGADWIMYRWIGWPRELKPTVPNQEKSR